MANSTSANLKLTVQATGENSGTWGQITNTNLLILEQAIGGYSAVTLNATTGATLTFSNGALSSGKDAVIKLTGTITTNVNVTIPDSVEKTYIVENGTSGAFTVTVKTTSGSGVTWAAADKGTKVVYSNGTDVVDTALTDVASDYSPQLSASLDANGNNIEFDDATGITDDAQNEQLIFSKTASAVNHLQVKNAAASGTPSITAIGDDTNIGVSIQPKGDGKVTLDQLVFPTGTGSADQILTTDGSGNLSFVDNSGGTSWQSVITADPANAVAGNGYFCDTSGGAFTVTLPTSPALGDEISFVDYAGTFDTNNLTIGRNGNPIQGAASDLTVSVERAGLTLVFVDVTQGWLLKNK